MSDRQRREAARRILGSVPFIMRAMGEGMRESGIDMSPVQYRLLMQISHRPRTLREIARLQGVTPATATSLVTTLENKGWVTREHGTEDRRVVSVAPTDEGRAALAEGQHVAEDAVAALLSSLDPDDLDRLIRGHEALVDATHC